MPLALLFGGPNQIRGDFHVKAILFASFILTSTLAATTAHASESEVQVNSLSFALCSKTSQVSIPKEMLGAWNFLLPFGDGLREETLVISERGDLSMSPDIRDNALTASQTCVSLEISKSQRLDELSITWRHVGLELSDVVSNEKAVVKLSLNKTNGSTMASSAHVLHGENPDFTMAARFYNPRVHFEPLVAPVGQRPTLQKSSAAASISPDKTE
jgi:hypothetical protein